MGLENVENMRGGLRYDMGMHCRYSQVSGSAALEKGFEGPGFVNCPDICGKGTIVNQVRL